MLPFSSLLFRVGRSNRNPLVSAAESVRLKSYKVSSTCAWPVSSRVCLLKNGSHTAITFHFLIPKTQVLRNCFTHLSSHNVPSWSANQSFVLSSILLSAFEIMNIKIAQFIPQGVFQIMQSTIESIFLLLKFCLLQGGNTGDMDEWNTTLQHWGEEKPRPNIAGQSFQPTEK